MATKTKKQQSIKSQQPKPTKNCYRCEGTGMVQKNDGSNAIDCPECGGSGKWENPYNNGWICVLSRSLHITEFNQWNVNRNPPLKINPSVGE